MSRISVARAFSILICTPHTLFSAALSGRHAGCPEDQRADADQRRDPAGALRCARDDLGDELGALGSHEGRELVLDLRQRLVSPEGQAGERDDEEQEGASEKIVKKAIEAARTRPLSAISSAAAP